MTSTPAATSAAVRSSPIGPGADRRADAQAPLLVLDRLRVLVGLEDVLDRDEPDELAVASTTSSFSMRCLCSSRLASSTLTPGGTVTSSFVISALTG